MGGMTKRAVRIGLQLSIAMVMSGVRSTRTLKSLAGLEAMSTLFLSSGVRVSPQDAAQNNVVQVLKGRCGFVVVIRPPRDDDDHVVIRNDEEILTS